MKLMHFAIMALAVLASTWTLADVTEIPCGGQKTITLDEQASSQGSGINSDVAARKAMRDMRDRFFRCHHCDKSGCNIGQLTVENGNGDPIDIGPDTNGEYPGGFWGFEPDGDPVTGVTATLTLPAGYKISSSCTPCVGAADPE